MAMNLKRIFNGFQAGDSVVGTIHRFGLNSSRLEKWGIIRRTQDETPMTKRRKFHGREEETPTNWYFTGNTIPQYDHEALSEFEEDDRRYGYDD